LKKVLNEQGVSFNDLANMSRNQLFHKIKEQDEPLGMLLNALKIYNVRKSHYGEHDTDDAILRRIALDNASKASRKSIKKAQKARKKARKSSGKAAKQTHQQVQCET
tara:strand:- start:3004 stop:3324 length:321 start_codon:yes stop_codon:yes gene_type:complete